MKILGVVVLLLLFSCNSENNKSEIETKELKGTLDGYYDGKECKCIYETLHRTVGANRANSK